MSDDPYGPGTIHDVTLVRQSPCSDVWFTTPDDRPRVADRRGRARGLDRRHGRGHAPRRRRLG